MGDLEIADLGVECFEIVAAGVHEFGIVGAEFYIVVFEEPGGIATEFCFGADVWAGAEDDP